VNGTSAAVEVRDDGRPAGDAGGRGDGPAGLTGQARGRGDGLSGQAGGRGNGLTGLAERIGAAGGRLEVGTLPEGGYRLYAQVPVETS
jgi:two-component system sensor histidine kinase DesK